MPRKTKRKERFVFPAAFAPEGSHTPVEVKACAGGKASGINHALVRKRIGVKPVAVKKRKATGKRLKARAYSTLGKLEFALLPRVESPSEAFYRDLQAIGGDFRRAVKKAAPRVSSAKAKQAG
jgi:hypothetical protein